MTTLPGSTAEVRMHRSRRAAMWPDDATQYRGPRWTVAVLAAYNLVGTARSLIHILAPDSGAGSIASMDTSVAGGPNMVGLLAQWGGAQLLEALVIWTVLLRYRGHVPLMLSVVTLEQGLRVAIGRAKPLVTAHAPPGALSRVLLPLAALVFVRSLTEPDEAAGRPSRVAAGRPRRSCALAPRPVPLRLGTINRRIPAGTRIGASPAPNVSRPAGSGPADNGMPSARR